MDFRYFGGSAKFPIFFLMFTLVFYLGTDLVQAEESERSQATSAEASKGTNEWKWSNPLPEHKELMALTLEKRRQYIRSLVRVVRDMGRESEFFSGKLINVRPPKTSSLFERYFRSISSFICIDPSSAADDDGGATTVVVTGALSPEEFCKRNEPQAINPDTAVRCMVAGWLPKGPKCQPTWVANIKFGEESKRLRCGKSAPILCNPIVFGVKENGKALCVKGGGEITKKCGDLSAELNNTEQISKVIEGNPELWNDFKERFNGGCKHGAVSCNYYLNNRSRRQSAHHVAKSDVFKTCFQAWNHLKKISQTAGLDHPDYGMDDSFESVSNTNSEEYWGKDPVNVGQDN